MTSTAARRFHGDGRFGPRLPPRRRGSGRPARIGRPEQMVAIARVSRDTPLPVAIQPNAGMPSPTAEAGLSDRSGGVRRPVCPLASEGAAPGGCCGTTPAHIRGCANGWLLTLPLLSIAIANRGVVILSADGLRRTEERNARRRRKRVAGVSEARPDRSEHQRTHPGGATRSNSHFGRMAWRLPAASRHPGYLWHAWRAARYDSPETWMF
jgi:hypothetical protein